MARVVFDGASKVYGDGTRALDRLDLVVEDGEFMVLVGPSGSGKSTALRMLAGLETVSSGEIHIDVKGGEFRARGRTFRAGEVITIDGSTGEVLVGAVKMVEPELSGAARDLHRAVASASTS